MFRERTIEEVVSEVRMIIERRTPQREDKFRMTAAVLGVIYCMNQGDWEEFKAIRDEFRRKENE